MKSLDKNTICKIPIFRYLLILICPAIFPLLASHWALQSLDFAVLFVHFPPMACHEIWKSDEKFKTLALPIVDHQKATDGK